MRPAFYNKSLLPKESADKIAKVLLLKCRDYLEKDASDACSICMEEYKSYDG